MGFINCNTCKFPLRMNNTEDLAKTITLTVLRCDIE